MLKKIREVVFVKDTNRVEGVMLEGIPFTSYGTQPGAVLIHRDWFNFYVMRERKHWSEDEYFNYALSQFPLLNIDRP